jgi:hypothetical protein
VWLRAGGLDPSEHRAGIGQVGVGRATHRTGQPRRGYTEERQYGDMEGAGVH